MFVCGGCGKDGLWVFRVIFDEFECYCGLIVVVEDYDFWRRRRRDFAIRF